jgi:tetratricopeptide (TPR) repeat protein
MRKIQFIAVLMFLGTFTTKAQSISEAKNEIVNENYAKAREILNKVIAAEKEPLALAEAHFWLGETFYEENITENKSKALEFSREQYSKGIVVAKNSPHCQVGMGKLLLDAKNGKEAAKTFDSAIRDSRKKPFKEGHPDIFMLVGDSYLNGVNKDPEMAVANYTRARDIDPKNAIYWLRLGDGSLAKGDAGAAMSSYEASSQLDKQNAEIYLKMARIWKRGKKNDLSIQNCIDGLKVNDKYALLYKELAELYYATGQFDKVTSTLDKYVPLAGQDFPARARFVKFLTYQAKAYDRAIAEAERLMKDDPTQTTMSRWIAWSNFEKASEMATKKQGTPEELKALYQKSNDASVQLMKDVPADRLVSYDYDYAAKSYNKIGKLDNAVAMYKKVIEMDTAKKCSIYTDIIASYYEAKKYKDGFDLLDEKSSGGCPVTYREYYLASYYAYYAKAYDRGDKYADKYIAIVPEGIDGYYWKGMNLDQTDTATVSTNVAKPAFEKVIALFEAKPEDRAKSMVALAYNFMGNMYVNMEPQDLEKAKEFYTKVLGVDAANKTATDMLGKLNGQ